MSSWTNTTKNSVTFANTSKNSASFTNTKQSHGLFYILTDLLDYVLLGENSDEVLIWDEPTTYTNLIKS